MPRTRAYRPFKLRFDLTPTSGEDDRARMERESAALVDEEARHEIERHRGQQPRRRTGEKAGGA